METRDAVLDFDLDYFLYPPIHYPPWAAWLGRMRRGDRKHLERKRLSWDQNHRFWLSRDRIRTRLRELEVPPLALRGAFEDHQEALPFWLDLVHSGALKVPFTVYHFDAHSDLYVSPEEQSDAYFERIARLTGQGEDITKLVHEANFLWWAIYMGLVDRIYWIVPDPQFRRDVEISLEGRCFRHAYDRETFWKRELQANKAWADAATARLLRRPAAARAADQEYLRLSDEAMEFRYEQPILCRRFGMEVELTVTTLERLTAIDNPRAVNICRSPDYTPRKADRLFDEFFAFFD